MKPLLKKLVEIPAPPGHEKEIRDVVRGEIDPFVEDIRVDSLGNLIARVGKKRRGGKKIMVIAHLDEIGLIATHINKNGFVKFTRLGGVYPHYLLGGRVRFLDGTRGLMDAEGSGRRKKVPKLQEMYIDVGVDDQDSCPVEIGDVAVFERAWLEIGNRIVSKALDDRVGVAVMIETLRRLGAQDEESPHQLWFVFSAQEEVSLRGAGPAAFQIQPDLGLAVDVTATGDTPQGRKMEVALGLGPAIKIRDRRMLSHPGVVDWMVTRAKENEIAFQREVLEMGTTDASSVQVTREGVPSGCLSIPCRYVHSPSEMIDWDDVVGAVDLLQSLLTGTVPFL